MADVASTADKWAWGKPVHRGPRLSEEIRENFDTLGRWNITDDETYPDSPRDGMPRVNESDTTNVKLQMWYDSAWQTLMQNLQAGVPAPAKTIFEITTAVAVWTLDHNFGSAVIVQVFDASWNILTPSNIQQVDTGAPPLKNRVVITHGAAQDGFAVIIG
jgi:hypothetical protein